MKDAKPVSPKVRCNEVFWHLTAGKARQIGAERGPAVVLRQTQDYGGQDAERKTQRTEARSPGQRGTRNAECGMKTSGERSTANVQRSTSKALLGQDTAITR